MTREDELKLKQVSEAFNAMPFEYRKIASDSETMVRIRDLQRLKDRLKANYEREIKYINETIKHYLNTIKS
jgi:hypothetical protein